MDTEKLSAVVEAILFVAGEPVAVSDLAHALDLTVAELEPVLDAMREGYNRDSRGIRGGRGARVR